MTISTINERVPSVWIACLAAYNEGILHGRWVAVPDTVEELQEEIDDVLKSSPVKDAEEWAFHDFEYFEPFDVSEWEDMETLVMKANVINNLDDHEREAFEVWEYQEHKGDDEHEILERFRDQFVGIYESERDFAIEDFDQCNEIPDHLEAYIDYDMVLRDYECYFTFERLGRNVAVFKND